MTRLSQTDNRVETKKTKREKETKLDSTAVGTTDKRVETKIRQLRIVNESKQETKIDETDVDTTVGTKRNKDSTTEDSERVDKERDSTRLTKEQLVTSYIDIDYRKHYRLLCGRDVLYCRGHKQRICVILSVNTKSVSTDRLIIFNKTEELLSILVRKKIGKELRPGQELTRAPDSSEVILEDHIDNKVGTNFISFPRSIEKQKIKQGKCINIRTRGEEQDKVLSEFV